MKGEVKIIELRSNDVLISFLNAINKFEDYFENNMYVCLNCERQYFALKTVILKTNKA